MKERDKQQSRLSSKRMAISVRIWLAGTLYAKASPIVVHRTRVQGALFTSSSLRCNRDCLRPASDLRRAWRPWANKDVHATMRLEIHWAYADDTE